MTPEVYDDGDGLAFSFTCDNMPKGKECYMNHFEEIDNERGWAFNEASVPDIKVFEVIGYRIVD